ncbi:MAG: hypothetical protein R2710_11175 [Acidimicrobiales bacterium]
MRIFHSTSRLALLVDEQADHGSAVLRPGHHAIEGRRLTLAV